MTLLAFSAERRAAAQLLVGARRLLLPIDISLSRGAQQQTSRTPRLTVERWNCSIAGS